MRHVKRIDSAIIVKLVIIAILLHSQVPLSAQEKLTPEQVAKLSLEELMQVKIVPAALTKLRSIEVPASITVITAEDIKHTPARNIYDLIEIYVPVLFG